jgi:hypothetical protein
VAARVRVERLARTIAEDLRTENALDETPGMLPGVLPSSEPTGGAHDRVVTRSHPVHVSFVQQIQPAGAAIVLAFQEEASDFRGPSVPRTP